MTSLPQEECQALIDNDYQWETSKLYRPIEESLLLRTFKEASVSVLSESHPMILKEVITKYEIGDFCKNHRDSGWGEVKQGYRAYSVWITPLNDEYEGGELYFADELIEQKVGETLKFDCRVRHKITPITKGTRHSLVSWVFKEQ